MKKILFFLLCIFSYNFSLAQKQNNHWIIGNKLVKFKYNSTSNFEVISPSLSKNFDQSPAIVSDKTTGDLLFYSDGETIWNNTRAIMDNGSGINGTSTLAQSVIIVPNPINQKQYYLFTLKADDSNNNSLYYSIIDMNENNGSGKVISKNNLVLSNIDNEKLASTFGHDKSYYWIIVRKGKNYYSYKLNSFGIQNPVISTTYMSSDNDYARKQKLKISPDSNYIASTINSTSGNFFEIELLKFNNFTGILIDHKTRNILNYTTAFKVSYDFSYDSQYFIFKNLEGLLCTCSNPYRISLIKYKLDTNEQLPYDGYYLDKSLLNTDIQLGADNNLYFINKNEYNSLGSIYKIEYSLDNNSYNIGLVNLEYGLGLTNTIMGGVPQLVQIPQNVCQQDLVIAQPILSSHIYSASNTITASSIINESLTVGFNAKQIILKPGFKVSKTNFNAKINPCSSFKINNQSNKLKSTYDTNKNVNFTISPNPTSNFVQVNSTIGINEWYVYDINAKVVLSGNNKNGNNLKINLQQLNTGLYYFKFSDSSGTIHEKTIIKK